MTLSPANSYRILCWLRAAAITGQLLAIAIGYGLFGQELGAEALLLVAAAYALWHGILMFRLRHRRVLLEARLTLEILVDVVTITALLCLSGGWTNPFASLYLVPMGFAAVILPLRGALLITGCAFAGYALTVIQYRPLPMLAPLHAEDLSVHLIGMWISLVVASIVVVATVSVVRRGYDREHAAHLQERELRMRDRESRMRDEQVLSLGVLAASTAHELGTPLSTARVLVEEMEQAPAAGADVKLLASQLDYAIDKLHQLVRVGDQADRETIDLRAFCLQIGDHFRTLRPETELREDHSIDPSPAIRYSRTLESAVLSLLMNAATASGRAGDARVEFTTRIENGGVQLKIRDYGHGMPEGAAAAQNGGPGMGVGLVISSATLESHGGEARYRQRTPGTEVDLTLPLERLLPEP